MEEAGDIPDIPLKQSDSWLIPIFLLAALDCLVEEENILER